MYEGVSMGISNGEPQNHDWDEKVPVWTWSVLSSGIQEQMSMS